MTKTKSGLGAAARAARVLGHGEQEVFGGMGVGKISEARKTITGQWEMSEDGKQWHVDFDLSYRKH